MTQSTSFERELASMLEEEAGRGPAEHVIDEVFAAARRTRQTPAWRSRIQEPAMRWHRAPAAGTSRRQVAILVAAALLILVGLAAVVGSRLVQPPATLSGDWPGFRGGPSRDGVGVLGPTGQPTLHWTFKAGAAVKDDIAIVGDVAIFASQDGILHAVAVEDGRERWTFAPGTSITGPTALGDLVLVADGRGIVHALAAATGVERWRSTTTFVSVGGLVTGDGRVYLGTGDGGVAALDAASGAVAWSIGVGSKLVHVPAFSDGSVFVATDDGSFAALRGSDGSRIWTIDVGVEPTGTPTVAGGIAYLGVGSDWFDGRLRAVDARTGAPVWTLEEPLFAPAVSGSLAVSASSTGVVSAHDAFTGVQQWVFDSPGQTRGPAIVGDVVYVANDLGERIDALDLATGARLWTFPVTGSNQCCVAVAKGFVFVGTMSGSVFAIGGDGSTVAPVASAARITAEPTVPPTRQPSGPPAISTPSAPVAPDPFTILSLHAATDLGLQGPLALAIGPSGDIYVTEEVDRVTQIGRDSAVLRRWGTHGSGPGQFDFTPAAAGENVQASIGVAPDGKVYVSDSDNHRIQVFSADGTYIRSFGSLGSGPGQFTIPFDVSADAAGNVYAIDDGLQRITKFTPKGDVAWTIDGTTDPRLDGHAHDADIDPDGRIVVLVDELGRVVIIDPDGTVRADYDAPGCDVTIDATGRHYVTGCGGGVDVYGLDHGLVARRSGHDIGAPQFGPDGEVVALASDGSLVFLSLTLPSN
jgi:outer membrane protein assembly factor BamB